MPDILNWFMTEGVDKYMVGIFAKNVLFIGFIFACAKVVAKYTPSKTDDNIINDLEKAVLVLKKQKGEN